MKNFGTIGHGLKHLTAVALSVEKKTKAQAKKEGKGKGKGRPMLWELDVGPRTVKEIANAAGLTIASIYVRLDKGERRWEKLTAPAQKNADGLRAREEMMIMAAKRAWVIKSEKAAYYAKMREGHKKL